MKFAIVLNYNNYTQTEECCNLLLGTSIDRVVVVDNASPNNSYDELRKYYNSEPRLIVVKTNENNGYAQGNNFGIEYVKTNLGISENNTLFIVNPDSQISENNISSIHDFIQRNKDAGMVSNLINGTSNNAWHHITLKTGFIFNFWIFRWLFFKLGIREGGNYKIDNTQKYIPVDVISGAFFGINQITMENVNNFDCGTFLYYEEEALTAKLNLQNKQNYLLNVDSFKHAGRGSTNMNKITFKKINDTSRLYILGKYYGAGPLYRYFSKFVNHADNFLLKLLRR